MSVTTTKQRRPSSSAYPSSPSPGIPRRETFAVKNMDNLLKLKLDMVYRDLDMETARKRHSEATDTTDKTKATPEPKTAVKRKVIRVIVPSKSKKVAKSKVVKALVPKST